MRKTNKADVVFHYGLRNNNQFIKIKLLELI
jgi:hypothetical protein